MLWVHALGLGLNLTVMACSHADLAKVGESNHGTPLGVIQEVFEKYPRELTKLYMKGTKLCLNNVGPGGSVPISKFEVLVGALFSVSEKNELLLFYCPKWLCENVLRETPTTSHSQWSLIS